MTAGELPRIVLNLVTNASEAIGDHDGVIRVSTAKVDLSIADASTKGIVPGMYVVLEVCDTGCGIPPATQAKIFDPFFSTKSAGRGIGLPVVHGIVRSSGGAIDFTSQPGKGTTFRILLPCSEASPELEQTTVTNDHKREGDCASQRYWLSRMNIHCGKLSRRCSGRQVFPSSRRATVLPL